MQAVRTGIKMGEKFPSPGLVLRKQKSTSADRARRAEITRARDATFVRRVSPVPNILLERSVHGESSPRQHRVRVVTFEECGSRGKKHLKNEARTRRFEKRALAPSVRGRA